MGKLKYLVIHCTATPEGREVSGAEIRAWHTNPVSKGGRGWKQVGYTDLFHLNGGVERLVNNNEDANVDPWEVTNGVAGYNSVSRHIVYAGGCAKDGKTPADTRTSWQKKALEKYAKMLTYTTDSFLLQYNYEYPLQPVKIIYLIPAKNNQIKQPSFFNHNNLPTINFHYPNLRQENICVRMHLQVS